MASYDQTDFDRMRQEAVARAREMQRRAQGLVSGQSVRQEQYSQQSEQHTIPNEAPNMQTEPQQRSTVGGILNSLLGSDSKIDEEKALIGMLIYILYKNGADVKLMLALGYLLL